jgi:hypothetical protein
MNWTFCSSRLNLSKVIESKSFKGWYYPQTRRKQIISRRLLQKLEEIFLPKIPWCQTNVLRMEDYIIVVYVAYSSCRLATLDTWRMNISHTLSSLVLPSFCPCADLQDLRESEQGTREWLLQNIDQKTGQLSRLILSLIFFFEINRVLHLKLW